MKHECPRTYRSGAFEFHYYIIRTLLARNREVAATRIRFRLRNGERGVERIAREFRLDGRIRAAGLEPTVRTEVHEALRALHEQREALLVQQSRACRCEIRRYGDRRQAVVRANRVQVRCTVGELTSLEVGLRAEENDFLIAQD